MAPNSPGLKRKLLAWKEKNEFSWLEKKSNCFFCDIGVVERVLQPCYGNFFKSQCFSWFLDAENRRKRQFMCFAVVFQDAPWSYRRELKNNDLHKKLSALVANLGQIHLSRASKNLNEKLGLFCISRSSLSIHFHCFPSSERSFLHLLCILFANSVTFPNDGFSEDTETGTE